eukprot:450396_1
MVLSQQAYALCYCGKSNGVDDVLLEKAFSTSADRSDGLRLSKRWLHKAASFTFPVSPGPVDNYDLCCSHDTQSCDELMEELSVPISRDGWDMLIQKYGGGPEVSTRIIPEPCRGCHQAVLERRRHHERSHITHADRQVPRPRPGGGGKMRKKGAIWLKLRIRCYKRIKNCTDQKKKKKK